MKCTRLLKGPFSFFIIFKYQYSYYLSLLYRHQLTIPLNELLNTDQQLLSCREQLRRPPAIQQPASQPPLTKTEHLVDFLISKLVELNILFICQQQFTIQLAHNPPELARRCTWRQLPPPLASHNQRTQSSNHAGRIQLQHNRFIAVLVHSLLLFISKK